MKSHLTPSTSKPRTADSEYPITPQEPANTPISGNVNKVHDPMPAEKKGKIRMGSDTRSGSGFLIR
jgi:hypothetical protein